MGFVAPARRRYDVMKGLGFGSGEGGEGEMEESEQEEGEACLGKEEDDCIDPDVDLSYIDVKLRDVLGHLQIEFEGGFSVENLGAKFGGYGSFLPTYKRSPSILSQPENPPKDPCRTAIKSPHGLSCEGAQGACYDSSIQINAPISKNSSTLTKDLDLGGSARIDAFTTSTHTSNHTKDNDLIDKGTKGPIQNTLKGACHDSSIQINAPISKNSPTLTKDLDLGGSARNAAFTTATTTSNHKEANDLINKGTKGPVQNTLKVRIKVGPDDISARNKAAIYSGLGLELSPSSSLEDSPEGIKGILEDGITNLSPRAILQMMTRSPISEGCFLSPLQENLLRLTKSGDHFSGNHKGNLLGKSIPEAISISGKLNSPLPSSESCRETATKLLPKNLQTGGNKFKLKDDKILGKKVDIETHERHDLIFQTSGNPLLLNSGTAGSEITVGKVVSKIQEDAVKGPKETFDQQTESSKMLSNENSFHSSLGNRYSFESNRSMESDGIVGLKAKFGSIEAKPIPGINLTRGHSVEKNMICGKNDLSCMQTECMEKPEKGINLNEVKLDEPKVSKDHIFGTNESINLNNDQKIDKFPEIKGKLKATGANATSVTDPPQKTMVSLSLLSGEKKKFHARDGTVEKKSKRFKESLHDYLKQSQREVSYEGKSKLVVGRTGHMVTPLIAKNKVSNIKVAKKKSRVRSVDNKSGTSLSFEAPIETCTDALIRDHSSQDASVVPGSIVIKDNWACCDLCEKWRLLPNGTNPDDLPKKWTCCMQFWLPVGMNHCIISEDETTKFMNPQYHTSLLESNSIPDHSALSTSSITINVNQDTCKMGSIIDSSYNQVRRPGVTSMETQKQKLKAKEKSLQCSSNGVDIRQSMDSKFISKELINSDISGAKMMINHNAVLVKDVKLSPGLTVKVAPCLPNGSSAADLAGKQMGEIGDKFLSNSLRDLKGRCSSLNGTMKAHLGVPAGQQFKQVSVIDTEMSDNSAIPVKKRKATEWRDSQINQETEMRSQHLGEKKENKVHSSKSAAEEYCASKMTGAIVKSHDKTRITSRTSKMFFDGMFDNQVSTVQLSAGDSVSSFPLRAYGAVKHSKIRNSAGKTDTKNSVGRSNRCLDGEVNGNMSLCSRRKEKGDFFQHASFGTSPASKSRHLSPLDGACNDRVRASFLLDEGKDKIGVPSKMHCLGVRGNDLPIEVGAINAVNSVSTIPDHHDKHLIEPSDKKPFLNQDKLNEAAGNDEDITHSHCGDRAMISESCKRLCVRDRNNTSEREFNKDKMKLSNVFSEQEELYSLINGKQGAPGAPDQGSHLMPSVKAKGLEVYPTGEIVGGLLESDKLTKASDNKNIAGHGSSRHEKADELADRCTMRKCAASNAALVAMKDAKELKHAADRMKNLGQELEGTALYFQAALKFLQAAFLSEPSTVVNIKYDELNESLKTYTQTAALCEFCAREYEKRKNMAFAALAYKCMEVAYFKVAFFKSHVAMKDHHELQATTRIFSQGGSPSSSASDLDNLNQPGALEKVNYSKVVDSLQNAGSNLIASRATFIRWLDYSNVSISALEASRKYQNALSVASASLEKDCGSIASVKEALNFNFHNVEELLRRIRAAMESFNH